MKVIALSEIGIQVKDFIKEVAFEELLDQLSVHKVSQNIVKELQPLVTDSVVRVLEKGYLASEVKEDNH